MKNAEQRNRRIKDGSLLLTPSQAYLLYDILARHCGASEVRREYFISSFAEQPCSEFRFQGDLGFGGKIYNANGGRLWVDCYPEDRTPERERMIEKAEVAIDALLQKWGLAPSARLRSASTIGRPHTIIR